MLSLSCFPLAGALILMKLIMGRVWGPKSLRDYLASDNNSLRWVGFGLGLGLKSHLGWWFLLQPLLLLALQNECPFWLQGLNEAFLTQFSEVVNRITPWTFDLQYSLFPFVQGTWIVSPLLRRPDSLGFSPCYVTQHEGLDRSLTIILSLMFLFVFLSNCTFLKVAACPLKQI